MRGCGGEDQIVCAGSLLIDPCKFACSKIGVVGGKGS